MISFAYWGNSLYGSEYSINVSDASSRPISSTLGSNNFSVDFGFTINALSIWFKIASVPSGTSGHYILSYMNENLDRYDIYTFGNNGTPIYRAQLRGNGGSFEEFSGTYRYNFTAQSGGMNTSWNHLVVGYNSNNNVMKAFINGNALSGTSESISFSIPSSAVFNVNKVALGGRVNDGAGLDNIKLDDAIWFTGLNATEWNNLSSLATLMYNNGLGKDPSNNGFRSPDNGWKCGDDDFGTGTTMTDLFGSVNLTFGAPNSFSTDTPF